MQSLRRFVLIAVSVMVAFTCINRHSVFVNHLSGQLPTIGALLAIGCLQPPASLASHASSASLEMFHRYTSVLVGVAVLGHHAAEAELVEVNKRNFKNTPYYGTPVRLKGKDIFITLNKHANHTSITWRFDSKSAWKIQLDKCDDGYPNAAIVIADSCKWQFVWNEMLEFRLIANDGKENSWKFDDPPLRKLQIELGKKKPTMTIYTVTGGGGTSLTDPTKNIPLGTPDFCMLATDNFNVNMTSTEPNCPISVTIMDAKLFYDFYDSTTATATTDVFHPLPVWTGTGSPPSGYATRAKINVPTQNVPTTSTGPPLEAAVIIGIVAGALVLIALLAGAVIALICICRRRRQEQGDYDFAEDPQVSAQVEKEEGLIEWEDVMAHAPYDVNTQPPSKNWPYGRGDTVELGSITANENTCSRGKPAEAKMYGVELDILRFLDDVKGTEDYGVVEGRFEWKAEGNPDEGSRCWSQLVVIYYSFPPDRVKVFVDRLKYLAKLDKARNDNIKKAVQAAKEAGLEGPPKELNCRTDQLRVPELKYFWVSPDPKKISFLVLEYHGHSLGQIVKDKDKLPLHRRVGLAFTTFVALASLHELGVVHRDVSPTAFVPRVWKGLASGKKDFDFCYITHLSLSRVQYDSDKKTWKPRRHHVKYFGSHKYASRAAHAQQERSFKDDLESWFYTAVDLIWPTTAEKRVMPWHFFTEEIGVTDREELHKKYKAAKDNFLRQFGQNKLIATFPAVQFRAFAGEILKMTFETREDDYMKTFIDHLQVMVEQLPTVVDVASRQAVLDYIVSLNEHMCYYHRYAFELKTRRPS